MVPIVSRRYGGAGVQAGQQAAEQADKSSATLYESRHETHPRGSWS